MTAVESGSHISIYRLTLVPGLITLGVTILRLVGELQHWPSRLFNSSPGGAGAIIGIVWLAPIFGIYFALKLAGAGEGPAGAGKSIGLTVIGLIVLAGGAILSGISQFRNALELVAGIILIAAAAVIPWPAWPSFVKSLVGYGYFARVPVAIVMFFAIRGNWGTHYDGPPPGFPEMGFWPKYLLIGLLPQLVFWVSFTVVVGSLFGTIAAALLRRSRVEVPAS
jgi:hypothetical protein